MVGEALALELGVEKGIEQGRARFDAAQQSVRPPVAEREPLAAEGRHVAGLRPVRRDEGGMRQALGEDGGQADQVLAIGADAMQQHDQLARRTGEPRRLARSGQ